MYENVSDRYKEIILNSGRTFKAKLVIGDIEYQDSIKSMSVTYGSCATDRINIGSTVSSGLKVVLDSTTLIEGTTLRAFIGLMVDGTIEWVPMGNYKITSALKTDNIQTIEAADVLATTAERTYVSNLTYPATTNAILEEICTILGIQLGVAIPDIIVSTMPLGYTIREMIGYIAGLYGKFAYIDRNNQLIISWYVSASYAINPNAVGSPSVSTKDYSVNLLEVASGTSVYTRGTAGSTGISCSNPFMREEIMDNAWTTVNGFSYRPAEINILLGDPRLDPCDIVAYQSYNIPLMNVTQTFDGGLMTLIKATSGTSEVGINYTGPVTKAVERVVASVEYLKANCITAEYADIHYADIHLAGIDIADIGTFLAECGLITTATIVDGHVTGYLDAVKVNANSITTGTLSTERLVIRGSNTSIVYELNNIAGALQSISADTLNGEILTQRTITPDKIVTNSITANEIATGTITADKINVIDLFAQDITATGTITGVHLVGATGSFSGQIDAATGTIGNMIISEDGFTSTDDSGTVSLSVGNGAIILDYDNPYSTNVTRLIVGLGFITLMGGVNISDSLTVSGSTTFNSTVTTNQVICAGKYMSDPSGFFTSGGIQIREAGRIGSANTSHMGYAPRLSFHWSGVAGASLYLNPSGIFSFMAQAGNVYAPVETGAFTAHADITARSGLYVSGNSVLSNTVIGKGAGIYTRNSSSSNILVLYQNSTTNNLNWGNASYNSYMLGNWLPNNNAAQRLGYTDNYWSAVYAIQYYGKRTSIVTFSDRRIKKDIKDLSVEISKKLIQNLNPVEYRLIDDNEKLQLGLIAQDVSDSIHNLGMSEDVYSLVTHEKYDTPDSYGGTDRWFISYTELIMPMIKVIQDLEKRIEKLEGGNL